jgi:hypothetical protein
VLTTSNAPWDELLEAEVQRERATEHHRRTTDITSPCRQLQAPHLQTREPVKVSGWQVGEADKAKKDRRIDCMFCGGKHLLSIGDIKSAVEACPCVRFLNEVWGKSFQYTRGVSPGMEKKGVSLASIVFSTSSGARAHTSAGWTHVVIFPEEEPMRAWLRFEYDLLQKGDSRVVGQPHRLLCHNLESLDLGIVGDGWEARVLSQVESDYESITNLGAAGTLRMAATLAFQGYKVIPPKGEPGLFPPGRIPMERPHVVKPIFSGNRGLRVPALQYRAAPY